MKMKFAIEKTVCLKCLLCLLHMKSVVATVIQGTVLEVSALLDTNVTLHCEVAAQDDIDFVLWKKIFSDDHDKVLIHNNYTTDDSKYRVDYPHGLTILGVQLEDEALYQCEINDIGARTVFHVLVPVSNLSLWAEGDREGGGPYNLTCHAQHARPPASLTWFRGTSDVTALSSSYTSSLHADGFGDSESVLHVPQDWYGEDEVFRCVAGVGDPSADKTAFLFLSLNGAALGPHAVPTVPFLSFILCSYLILYCV